MSVEPNIDIHRGNKTSGMGISAKDESEIDAVVYKIKSNREAVWRIRQHSPTTSSSGAVVSHG